MTYAELLGLFPRLKVSVWLAHQASQRHATVEAVEYNAIAWCNIADIHEREILRTYNPLEDNAL